MRILDALRVKRGDVITLVGGGGKTTLMFRLAEELTTAGMTVVSTMTTKIFVGQMERAPASLLLCEDNRVPGQLEPLLAQHRHVIIGCRIGADREKVEGVPPETVDQIAAMGLADVVIVEADGSRRLPFKAPAGHEPVVPGCTTVLVPLVGLDILGQPLNAEHVHRAQLVSALADTPVDEPVTPLVIARVLGHGEGGAKGLPDAARLVPVLNKADPGARDRMAEGREIARLLLHSSNVQSPKVDEVVIAAAETGEPVREVWGRVAAVILAAGGAKRFGRLKQVMPWHGSSPGATLPLVAHIVQQVLACPDIDQATVASGAQADLVDAALAPYSEGITVVRVDDWLEGQSRSVRAGLRAARLKAAGDRAGGELSGALFLLADQPGITPDLLSALVQRHRETLAPVVAPRYQGQRGNPVLFDRGIFGEFEVLEGDIGARPIIQRYVVEQGIAWVDWPTGEILRDIDTPEDYAAASGTFPEGSG